MRPAHGGYPTPLGSSDEDLARTWHDAQRAARALVAAQFPDAMALDMTPTALGRFVVVPVVAVEGPSRELAQIEGCLVHPDERRPGRTYERVQEVLAELRALGASR